MPFDFADPVASDMTPVVTPLVADGAMNRPIDQALEWTVTWNPAIGRFGRAPYTSLWFGTTDPPPQVLNRFPGASGGAEGAVPPGTVIRRDGLDQYHFDPGPLAFNVTYYWVVAVMNHFGWLRVSPVYSFTTSAIPLPDAPETAPTLARAAGTGIEVGVHQYGYTYVNASGESVSSPTAAIDVETMTAPPAPGYSVSAGTLIANSATATVGDTFEWFATYSTGGSTSAADASKQSPRGTTTGAIALEVGSIPGNFKAPILSVVASTDPSVNRIFIWARRNGGTYYLVLGGNLVNATASTGAGVIDGRLFDGVAVSPATTPPAAGSATERVNVSAIAVGPGGTTARKLYRTVAGGSQLKLVTTIADNTTTTYTDSTPDGSLGANAP